MNLGLTAGLKSVMRRVASTLGRAAPAAVKAPEPPKHGTHKHVGRTLRMRVNNGRPIFGPALPPIKEFHHVSRQTCRAYLRAKAFEYTSARYPQMSRRDRRRAASVYARLEYRRMMADGTNAIPEAAEQIYRLMTPLELSPA